MSKDLSTHRIEELKARAGYDSLKHAQRRAFWVEQCGQSPARAEATVVAEEMQERLDRAVAEAEAEEAQMRQAAAEKLIAQHSEEFDRLLDEQRELRAEATKRRSRAAAGARKKREAQPAETTTSPESVVRA